MKRLIAKLMELWGWDLVYRGRALIEAAELLRMEARR